VVAFGHLIPIGGILPKVFDTHTALVGDAAGFCGAFAADGIKGAVVSGKVLGELIPKYLAGDTSALKQYHARMQTYNKLITYYKKQVFYRLLWNRMKSDRTFHAMFDLVAHQKDSFLYQFCDSKDKQKSLVRVVLKIKNIPQLFIYGWYLFLDLFK
jgi:flavin-dependent dehydrogenase